MPKVIIELDAKLTMTGPDRCIEGMEKDWWKKFTSSASGVSWVNLNFYIDPKVAAKPPMLGEYGDFSDVSPLTDTGSLCFQESSLLEGNYSSNLDPKEKTLTLILKGKFGFWAGPGEDNDDNWDQIFLSSSLKGEDPIPALKSGKFLFATVCQPVDKKGKVVKTNTTQFTSEMWIQLAPEKGLAVPIRYKIEVIG